MNVLLLQAPFTTDPRSHHDVADESYPLGLAYLHAAVESAGHRCVSRDFAALGAADAIARTLDLVTHDHIDILGVQVLTTNRHCCIDLIRAVQAAFPKVHVLVGGPHVTDAWRSFLPQIPDAIAVVGEAERVVPDLLARIGAGVLHGTPAGVARILHGVAMFGGRGPQVEEIDSLPMPKHSAFIDGTTRFASILTSRGCPFTCDFCSVSRRQMRYRSAAGVVDELEYLLNNYPRLELVRFWDDQFFFKPARVFEVCNEIVRRRLKLQFTCLARIKPCSAELVHALTQAGCVEVGFGLETGSEKVALGVHKGVRPIQFLDTLEYFRYSNIRIFAFLIVGLPGETWQTLDETISLMRQARSIRHVSVSGSLGIATVYPSTTLHQLALDAGAISDRVWIDEAGVPLFTAEHKTGELLAMKAYLEDALDDGLVFERHRAIDMQAATFAEAWAHYLRQVGSGETPHCLNVIVAKYANLAAETVRCLEKRGALAIRFSGPLSDLAGKGGRDSSVAVFRRSGVSAVTIDRHAMSGTTLLIQLALWILEGRDERLRSLFVDTGLGILRGQIAASATTSASPTNGS